MADDRDPVRIGSAPRSVVDNGSVEEGEGEGQHVDHQGHRGDQDLPVDLQDADEQTKGQDHQPSGQGEHHRHELEEESEDQVEENRDERLKAGVRAADPSPDFPSDTRFDNAAP